MKCPRLGGLFLLLFALIVASSCEQRSTPPKPRQQTKATLDADGLIVTPLADGSAYANDAGAVWYVRGDTGTRVKGLPEKLDVIDIAPTVDGGAYMTSGSGLWYLHDDSAVKVREGVPAPRTGTALSQREKWLWASLQVERQRGRQVETDSQDDDRSHDDDNYPGARR